MNQSDSKNKILIATGIYSPDIGGPATMLGALFISLTSAGFGVKVITYSDIKNAESEAGLVCRIRRWGPAFWRHAQYFLCLLFMSFWADVVYATDTYSVGRFAYLIKKLARKKYILRFTGDSAWEIASVNGWTADYIMDFQEKHYDDRIERLKKRRNKILFGADAVIVDSEFNAFLARKIGVPPDRINVVYNSVTFFKDSYIWQRPDEPTLVFSGRLVPWKGVAMLINAVSELKKSRPGIKLEILGDGPKEDELKKMARDLGVQDNVRFYGRVSEEKSHEIFARSSIFVLNTNYEGLANSVLNAMRVGLPVITTLAGGNPEIIQDGQNGLLIPYNDQAAFLAAIDKLLSDVSLQDKFSREGKATLEKFKWENTVSQTIKVINDLC